MRTTKPLGMLAAALGAIASLVILFTTTSAPEAASDILWIVGFYVWVLLPFALLVFLVLVIHGKGRSAAARLAIAITAIAVSSASAWLYYDSIFRSESSTAALAFVVVPLYSLAATAVLFGIAWLLLRFVMPERRTSLPASDL